MDAWEMTNDKMSSNNDNLYTTTTTTTTTSNRLNGGLEHHGAKIPRPEAQPSQGCRLPSRMPDGAQTPRPEGTTPRPGHG